MTRRSPDGEACEAERVAGAAERGEDGGLERGGRAVGDGADRVRIGEGGVARGGGGREGEDGGEDEVAALGHRDGGTGNILLSLVGTKDWGVRRYAGSGRWARELVWDVRVLYTALGPSILLR